MESVRTPRENFLDMSKGIPSDYLLQFAYGPNPYSRRPLMSMFCGPGFLNQHRSPEGGKDIWGVNYVTTRDTGYSGMPEPNNFILKDITKWRDVIKAPDISGINWEKMAQDDLAMLAGWGINPQETAMMYSMHFGYFQLLMSFMGFTEGLCAIVEEPEEVKALMEYMCDFYTEIATKSFDYYSPDMVEIVDDTAAWGAPFISTEQYREIFKPCHAREAKFATDRGLPVAMHDCGKCEPFIEDWLDIGVKYWEPAQTCNDLHGIKEKYGKDLIVIGGWDPSGELLNPDCSEETFKTAVNDVIDDLLVGGNYIFDGWMFGDPEDETVNNKNKWLTESVEDYDVTRYRSFL
ncbi:uroporphyrinogen decarboxylase family protein [Eubacteriaceae bacterium ES2]|nr:uroporphyrinogen decarboxylase family protein [Eubacteriaceae bacterium ES2]